MKFIYLLQRKICANIPVHDEKRLCTTGSDLVTEVVEATGSAEGRKFLEVFNGDFILLLDLEQEWLYLGKRIVANEKDLFKLFEFYTCFYVVLDDRDSS